IVALLLENGADVKLRNYCSQVDSGLDLSSVVILSLGSRSDPSALQMQCETGYISLSFLVTR
ncbi:hypothetical protein S83_028918, partial [Arachis hypogaea]